MENLIHKVFDRVMPVLFAIGFAGTALMVLCFLYLNARIYIF